MARCGAGRLRRRKSVRGGGGVTRLRARAQNPGAGGRLPRRLLDSAMGSVQAAGSVRARYLVYFQYVGTDFK